MDRPKPSGSGEAWASGDAASGWKRGAAARGRALDPLTELMLDLAEDDRATAGAEIKQTLRPFVEPDGFAAPSEALIVVGVA